MLTTRIYWAFPNDKVLAEGVSLFNQQRRSPGQIHRDYGETSEQLMVPQLEVNDTFSTCSVANKSGIILETSLRFVTMAVTSLKI